MPEFDDSVEYRPIPGYANYMAGGDGSVWSCLCRRHRGTKEGGCERVPDETCWHQLKPTRRNKYLAVLLYDDCGDRKFINVNILILLAFVGFKPHPKAHCRHMNGCSSDNRLENLCWGTVQENHDDKQKHGTTARGSNHGRARLNEDQVREIKKMLRDHRPTKEIADPYGVGDTTIRHIYDGNNWKHVD